ncbi:hypothetical protein [Actinacidiphila glaucinigra]|uniref:hypothetical protein n=1 Tax=Actinacidiphila glaucinigra TaxID=235986 RepID=UPI0036729448
MQVLIIEDEPAWATAGFRLDPFGRDLSRNRHHVSSAGKQFAALEGEAASAPAVCVTFAAVRRHTAGGRPRGSRA